ncbi:hypothetical protein J6W34_04710 [bacterium]|nr:hypothetical protein [bacterium]
MKKLRQKKISEILQKLFDHYEDGSPMKEVWKNDKDTFYVIEKSSFGSESFIRIFFTDDDRVEVKVEKIIRIYEDTNRMSDIILEKSFLIWNEPLEFTEKMMTWEHFSSSLYNGIMDVIEEYSQKLNNQIKKYFNIKLKNQIETELKFFKVERNDKSRENKQYNQ